MSKKFDDILSKSLISKKLITNSALDAILKDIAVSGEMLSSVLIKQKKVAEKEILNILADKLNISYINLKKISIEKSVLEKVPVKFAGYYKCMPIKREGRVLTIACSFPLKVKVQDEIRTSLGCEIKIALACEEDIRDALKKHYGLGAETVEKIISATPPEHLESTEIVEEKIEDIEKLAQEASIIKLVNQIISEAHRRRATDIHIEPYRGKVKLRYRIDGILYSAKMPPGIKNFLSPMLSRIKIMANLNIVERRLPQDGRAIVKIAGETLDLRISFIPTVYGESMVIRILPMQMLFSLERLGLLHEDLNIFKELIKKPHGIIFITGPTGSGKTTTLYTCLSEMNTDERKIITIEDPIEYEIEGIIQIQVMPLIGLDFSQGLRSMLRHDPDVMMIGEVRDLDTAEIAIRVALTGHLVFSTLHTNDAASGITRLIDIGLEPYLVASSVEAFVAQRLVRVICSHCKKEDKSGLSELREQIAKDINLRSKDEVKIYMGQGCESCNFTGFYGRTAIYEILVVDETIRKLTLKKASAEQIKKAAIAGGMQILRQSGWKKVIEGVTTPQEVMKITQEKKHEFEDYELLQEDFNEDKAGNEDINKRAFRRLNDKLKMQYRIVKPKPDASKKGEGIDNISRTENISAGGMLFISNEPLPIKSILEVKINLPDEGKALQCLARVIRVEKAIDEENYNIAVCFLDMSGAERTRLDEYVKARKKRS